MIMRHPVESSVIRSVGYDPVSHTLEIEFTSGSVYHYFNVPDNLYEDLKTAESKGAFVNEQLKPFYRYEMVEDKPFNIE